ncbi:MAG TPA: nucleoside-diphosphate kinase, partial [Deltaproteobacteria bacterium]|nr:nucleoside-diphosphate kinase [Deltaproteobacteria bacterium]
MTTENLEQSLVLIKPDALKNSLTGYILSQFSEFHTGLRFAALKVVSVNRVLAEEHYAEHKGKFFFPSLLEYIRGYLHYPDDPRKRRVIAIVYQGPEAIRTIRDICGPTNPHDA